MRKAETSKIAFLQFANLLAYPELRHGVSLRHKAVGGESPVVLCSALGLKANHLVRHKQVHGNHIAVVRKPAETVREADGLCTNQFDIPLMLLGADCPLIIVYDPAAPAVGLAHAGWRGIVQQVTMNLVETMVREFGGCAGNMLAGIGPGICGDCYIVGEAVMMIALLNLGETEGLFRPVTGEKSRYRDRWYFDLIEANRRQLLQSGIPPEKIEISDYCTYERPDLFPSYRREGVQAGRWTLLAGLFKT